jgi:ligand-binding SRPBCC domain-containing protein
MPARTITQTSLLRASPDAVWAQVSSMRGVNEELAPWLSMSFPDDAKGRRLTPEDAGHPLFTSTLRLFRVLPYDRHAIQLTRVTAGRAFLEESTSWTMRVWQHERTLEAAPGGTQLTDRLTFEPRLPGMAFIAERLVRAVFRHRHAVLRGRFGEGQA